jgi:hypothetical protein
MTVLKGFPSKARDLELSNSDIHVTAEPVRVNQIGLDVINHATAVVIGTDTVEASSTTNTLNLTGHAAWVGDIIRFTSGALSTLEAKVIKTTTNTVILGENLPSDPSTLGIEILRYRTPVVSSSGGAITTLTAGSIQGKARIAYGTTPVTTGAYVQVIASAPGSTKIQVFEGAGESLVVALGGAGAEVDYCYIFPGGQGDIDVSIPAGTRVSVKAVSANCTSGELLINFIG